MSAEPVTLVTADGLALEGERWVPDGAWAAAVLTHPHPNYGGDMRTPVPAALFAALPAAGVAALRFNFRGVGRSEGTHAEGRDERLDVVAALDALDPAVPGVPLVVAGWSFGADVALAVGDERIAGWCAVAAPLRVVPPDELVAGPDPRPVVLAVPEHDQFRPPAAAREATAHWAATDVEVVGGADHFLLGRTDVVADICLRFVQRLRR